jgi:excisionase family DNA binding protein
MSIIGERCTPVLPVTLPLLDLMSTHPEARVRYYGRSDAAYLSPEQAAQILRMSVHTLYRVLRRSEIPAMRVGPHFKIPVTFQRWQWPLRHRWRLQQLEFEYDVPIHPVKVWRNTRQPVEPWSYDAPAHRTTRW